MSKKGVFVDAETHKRLKVRSANEGRPIGDLVKEAVDALEEKRNAGQQPEGKENEEEKKAK